MSNTSDKLRLDVEVDALSDSAARKRLTMLFDEGTYHEIDRFLKNGERECEVVAGFGTVNGTSVYAYAQSIDVSHGAMGKVQASKISHIYDLASKTGAPVVGVFDSDGAHVDEGVDALEAYGKLIKAAGSLSGVVPQIAVIAGPCIGSAAVLASLADVVVMEKDAQFYVTAPAFTDNRETKVGTAKLACENATVSVLADDDKDAMTKVADLLAYLPSNNLSLPLLAEYVPAAGGSVLESCVDSGSFFELNTASAKSIRTGFARIGGVAVGIVETVAEQKDGYFCPGAAKKAARFVRLCDAFSVPVVTLVDSLGVVSSEKSELAGGVKSVSLLTSAYSNATTAKITIVTGNAIGGAYIAFVSSASDPDFVYAWSDSVIGALEPMTAVQLLYKKRLEAGEDRKVLETEYAREKCSPFIAAAAGYVDDVISPDETASKLVAALDLLASKRVPTIAKKHSNIPL